MLKTKKSKIILGIILAVVAFSVAFAILYSKMTFSITFRKRNNDSLQKVEKRMGQDIRDVKPLIDEAVLQYNNKNFQYLYANLFVKELREQTSVEEFNKSLEMTHGFMGKIISYDMERSRISIKKTNHGEIIYSFDNPAKFEKLENGRMKMIMHKDKSGEIKLYIISLDTFN